MLVAVKAHQLFSLVDIHAFLLKPVQISFVVEVFINSYSVQRRSYRLYNGTFPSRRIVISIIAISTFRLFSYDGKLLFLLVLFLSYIAAMFSDVRAHVS